MEPLDGYVAVCLALATDIYALIMLIYPSQTECSERYKFPYRKILARAYRDAKCTSVCLSVCLSGSINGITFDPLHEIN